MLKYYVALRSVLRTHPHLRRCLKHCQQCRVFFLTYPSNDKRTDLLCPFGCSAAHRRREASERSAVYYRTEEGRKKKSALNRKRYLVYSPEEPEAAVKEDAMEEADREDSILEHVRMVTSLIEGREVSLEEIKEMLKKKGRQHSLSVQQRVDYLLDQLNKSPPGRGQDGDRGRDNESGPEI